MAADIVIYDIAQLKRLPEEIAYDLPANEWRREQKAEGYRWITVKGEAISVNATYSNRTRRAGQGAPPRNACAMMLSLSPSGALLWRMWSCTASTFVKTTGSCGSSSPPIGTPGCSLSRTV